MSTVQLSYLRLFREICEKLHMETSQCVVAPAAEGTYLAYIDLPIERNESIIEIVRCWGLQSSTSAEAEHDAARVATKRMVEELDLQVRDVNFDDSIFYKNLYNHLATKYAMLFAQYMNLVREYNFVKDCYVATLAQINEFVIEQEAKERKQRKGKIGRKNVATRIEAISSFCREGNGSSRLGCQLALRTTCGARSPVRHLSPSAWLESSAKRCNVLNKLYDVDTPQMQLYIHPMQRVS
uniref:Uncharacterized protein n=1 Tax=Ananas comosus var. bracteatus TaxID=296719 RepID=A0A6V7NPS5_ANACO|nr:unnamed protein product [Ananas comosus var. bracteatus]